MAVVVSSCRAFVVFAFLSYLSQVNSVTIQLLNILILHYCYYAVGGDNAHLWLLSRPELPFPSVSLSFGLRAGESTDEMDIDVYNRSLEDERRPGQFS